jgi:hypothetical protein
LATQFCIKEHPPFSSIA